MKVLIGMTRSDTTLSGSFTHICQIGEHFRKHGIEAVFILGGEGKAIKKLRALGFKVHALPHLKRTLSPIFDIVSFTQLYKIVSREKPDVCSWHTSKIGALGRIAAALFSIKSYYVPHGVPFVNTPANKGYKLFGKIERALSILPSTIVCVCKFDFDQYRQINVKENKLLTIFNGMEVHQTTETKDVINDSNHRKQTTRFITAARFEAQKDYKTLAKSCHLLHKSGKSFELHIYGDGPQEATTRSYFKGLPEGYVTFKGVVENFAAELISADVFLLCSHWEGLPRSIIEAMACRKPIIASNVGGVEELITPEKNGYLIPLEDEASFADAMKTYIDQPQLITEHGTVSHKLYNKSYRLEKMLALYSKEYFGNGHAPNHLEIVNEPIQQ